MTHLTKPKFLLACGLALAPLFYVVVVAQMLTRTGFDIGRHPLSLLSLGDAGWIQIAKLHTHRASSNCLFCRNEASFTRHCWCNLGALAYRYLWIGHGCRRTLSPRSAARFSAWRAGRDTCTDEQTCDAARCRLFRGISFAYCCQLYICEAIFCRRKTGMGALFHRNRNHHALADSSGHDNPERNQHFILCCRNHRLRLGWGGCRATDG